ncbi:aminotransferase class I/II-fold pyridoxal phosphate-dependent enzyme [Leifsonia poae]|uniref:aminotransferase class I/II-fold pyridoxal phosphate-dependent enzyme n=1 Tax=Leifsonia poae TaxID=110933 RepID=UPI003D68A454
MASTPLSAADSVQPLPSMADLRQWETPYADALERHAAREPLTLMVPGHGGDELGLSARLAEFFGTRPLQLDLPMLVDGVDLGDDSPLSRSLELAADAWGARRTWFLTGGASQANRIAALAVRGLGENILSQRSAHSSFSDGVLSAGLAPSFVMPSLDTAHGVAHGVSPDSLDAALTAAASAGRPADAVYVVTPSYFGAVADVAGLARVAHAHGAPLIVDGAWGPHFGFHPGLPESPARLGADLVVSSTHKLGGSLTQSAMLHLGDGPFAEALEPLVERAVSITASTSTSALLQASLDIARHSLATGAELIGRSIAAADAFRAALRTDPRFGVLSDGFGAFDDIAAVDPLRVVVDVSRTGVSGHWLRQRLADADGIFFEMSTATTLVALIGAGKTPDLERAHRALAAAVDSADAHAERSSADTHPFPALPEPGPLRMLPRDAFFAGTELVTAADAVGRVSADTLAAYPPGIPNLIPGEEITAQTAAFLQAVAASPSGYVRGAVDPGVARFRVTLAS